MNDHMNRKEIQERFADSAVAMFMEQYMTEIAEVADENAEDDSIEISEEFDRRGRKLIKKGLAKKQRQHAAKKLLRVAKVAVITLFILLGTFAILFTTVEAIRVPIINFFLEQEEEYLEVNGVPKVEHSVDNLLEGLLQVDYNLEACQTTSNGNISIVYKNSQDDFVFYDEFNTNGGVYRLDTEDAITESISIAGNEAILIYKYGFKLVWFNSTGSFMYQLDAPALSREEIIELAEAIEERR